MFSECQGFWPTAVCYSGMGAHSTLGLLMTKPQMHACGKNNDQHSVVETQYIGNYWILFMYILISFLVIPSFVVHSRTCIELLKCWHYTACVATHFWKGASILSEFSVALLWSLLRRWSLPVITSVRWFSSKFTLCNLDSGISNAWKT